MLNYAVDPRILERHRPAGTELDAWEGRSFVSLVGFRFLDTRVRGLAIPFHTDFEEVNLRFYVRRRAAEGWRRGVVFIREVVPRRAIAWIARRMYNEPYRACPMSSTLREPSTDVPGDVAYAWKTPAGWVRIGARFEGKARKPCVGSAEEFITEHYWGYSAQRDGSSLEYRVEHPRWRVWSAAESRLEGDATAFYGPELGAALRAKPASAFVAEGSAIAVHRGRPLGDGDYGRMESGARRVP